MPRFYFHLYNDVIALDEEGAELPDLAAAREYALENAREMVCSSIKAGHLNLDHRIEVTDDGGERVMTLTFRDAFILEG